MTKKSKDQAAIAKMMKILLSVRQSLHKPQTLSNNVGYSYRFCKEHNVTEQGMIRIPRKQHQKMYFTGLLGSFGSFTCSDSPSTLMGDLHRRTILRNLTCI